MANIHGMQCAAGRDDAKYRVRRNDLGNAVDCGYEILLKYIILYYSIFYKAIFYNVI